MEIWRLQVFELGDRPKGSYKGRNRFCKLVHSCVRRIPEKLCRGPNVHDLLRVEPHESGACGVCGHRVVGENDSIEWPRIPIQGPISFHRHNRVGDYEMDWDSRTNVQDAPLNPFPVKDILRPAVFGSRHNSSGECGRSVRNTHCHPGRETRSDSKRHSGI
jgi:hypothetical protein